MRHQYSLHIKLNNIRDIAYSIQRGKKGGLKHGKKVSVLILKFDKKIDFNSESI